MGNEGLYSVGKGMRKGTLKNNQVESFAGLSRLGLNREVTHEIKLVIDFQIPACASNMTCFMGQQSRASREILIFTNPSPNSHTQLLH